MLNLSTLVAKLVIDYQFYAYYIDCQLLTNRL